MKKIVVSDYDNTFYRNDDDIEKNKLKVKEFMELSNIFIIATGRSYLDFMEKEDLYKIKYNYLILDHGATILKDDEIIFTETINNSIKKVLLYDLKLEVPNLEKLKKFMLDLKHIQSIKEVKRIFG